MKSIYFRRDTSVKNVGGFVIYSYDVWNSKGSSDQSLHYSINSAVTTKLIRLMHLVLGADEYCAQDSNKIITNNSIVNIYIVYKLSPKTISIDNDLKNCLFGAIKASRPNNTTDSDKYIYSGYGIGFDHTGTFTHPEGNLARNVIIFGADRSGSVYASNKTQNILVLGKAFIQKINNTTIYAEKMYPPDFSAENKIFVLSLHYNDDNSHLFVNGQNVTQFKAKKSEIRGNRMFLGSFVGGKSYYDVSDLSKDDVNDIKLYGNAYDFSVDYSTISNNEILKKHKYLMKKDSVI